jgi:prepilin-type N-terminal cleavage/methylation domain-containing protein
MEKHKQLVINTHHKNVKRIRGFTIVELIVVIVVIGILSAIGVAGYGEITKKVAVSQVKNDLLGAAAAMEKSHSLHSKYPDTLPADYKYGSDTQLSGADGLSVFSIGGGHDYCIEASSIKRPNIGTFSISSYGPSTTINNGGCAVALSLLSSIFLNQKAACATALDNKVYCWGDNELGQLGNGTDYPSGTVAVDMTGVLSGKTIKSIASGGFHTCAIASDNKVYCWGWDINGQLGNNSTETSFYPVAVDMTGVLSGKTIKSISAGSNHTCAIASDDKPYCWGSGDNGQLGNNSTESSSVPVEVDMSGALAGKTVKSISLGEAHSCVIASDDKPYCWGWNTSGQLGDNTLTGKTYPVAVVTGALGGKTVKSISAGARHTCVIASDDFAYCWGSNVAGQVGNNSTSNRLSPAAVVTGALGGKTVKSISAGGKSTCAIASDNYAYCWGFNTYGNLGDNTTNQSLIPVAVDRSGALNGKTIKSISSGQLFSGYYHSCAIATDNKSYCWGIDFLDTLGGYGSTYQSLVPVIVDISHLSGQ